MYHLQERRIWYIYRSPQGDEYQMAKKELKNKTKMRDAFASELFKLAKSNKDVIFINSSDGGFGVLMNLQKNCQNNI